VWDPNSPYYLEDLGAVMVSYADFHRSRAAWRAAAEHGLRAYLGVPAGVEIFLDNGAFYFLGRDGEIPQEEYRRFVEGAQPDWYPIPQDFIPRPQMTDEEQRVCFERTMLVNRAFEADGYTPIVHVGRFLREYTNAVRMDSQLMRKPAIALGAIVPNLLRAVRAVPYTEVLDALRHVREAFASKRLHVFGIGGTATLHLAALLEIDSVDSSGWRNRAARGLVQLPGSGDRIVAELGSWRGRRADEREWARLQACFCPGCGYHGPDGLRQNGLQGASHRATHNLWILLQEAAAIKAHLAKGSYTAWYERHLENTTYLPLIRRLVELRFDGAFVTTEAGLTARPHML
jgi:hypothetical protein